MSASQKNKFIIQRYIEEVWNQRQLDGIDTLFEENYTIHQNDQALTVNREMLKQSIRTILNAFPDFHMTLDSLVAEGDRVAAYWINRGTQTGELRLPDMPQSAPPSARTTTFAESALFRIATDKNCGGLVRVRPIEHGARTRFDFVGSALEYTLARNDETE